MTQVIQTPIKPKKPRQPVLRKCFGTEFSHRLFDQQDPREPRLAIGAICPNCALPLNEWSEAVYRKPNLAIPSLPAHPVMALTAPLIEPALIAASLLRKAALQKGA